MSGTTILISPLNWGFGHAGRMIPLARELQRRGNKVLFGADARLLPLLESELPGIKLIEIPGLHIRYSRLVPQYVCIFLQMPKMICSAVREHYLLERLAKEIKPSVIISDNRFGFWHREIFSVYVTHQLRIPFPRLLRFMEPFAAWVHRRIISKYDLCLVPDYPGEVNLSGRLSHDLRLPANLHYMGPLSRFRAAAAAEPSPGLRIPAAAEPSPELRVLAAAEPLSPLRRPATPDDYITPGHRCCSLILSGPEPQRSLLLERVTVALRGFQLYVLSATPVQVTASSNHEVTCIIKPDSGTMRDLVLRSTMVITRAGYTSVMELVSLGKGAVLIPTPGQTEQEYLGEYLNGRHGFIAVNQNDTGRLGRLVEEWMVNGVAPVRDIARIVVSAEPPNNEQAQTIDSAVPQKNKQTPSIDSALPQLPDSTPLFAEALNLILEQKKE